MTATTDAYLHELRDPDGKWTTSAGTLERVTHPIGDEGARGNSRAVSHDEFQQMAAEGRDRLRAIQHAPWSTEGLHRNWTATKARTFAEVQKSWGGATVDPRTGRDLPQGADKYAMSVKPTGMDTTSIPEDASRANFDQAMDAALAKYGNQLAKGGSYLGIFHDDDLHRIDIDPVTVLSSLREVETVGAWTHAIGGAYHFASGDGFWPPHVPGGAQMANDTQHWAGPGQWHSHAINVQQPHDEADDPAGPAGDQAAVEFTAQTATASTVHHPFGSPSGPGLFRVKGLQLPAYIQNVAHALMRKGSLDESRAISMAVGIVKNWAAGHDGHGHKVSADVQAAAVKAIAEWEADKARAHAHTSGHRAALELAAWQHEMRGPGGKWADGADAVARVVATGEPLAGAHIRAAAGAARRGDMAGAARHLKKAHKHSKHHKEAIEDIGADIFNSLGKGLKGGRPAIASFTGGHRDALELAAWPTELRGPGGQWITMGGKPVRVTKLRYRGGAGGFGHLRAIEAVGAKYQPQGELATSPRMGPAADVYRDSMRSAARFTAARQMDHANRALDMADWAARHIGPQAQIDARRVRASLAAVPATVSYRTNQRVGAQKMRGQHPGVYRDPLNASNQQREAIALARVAPGGGGSTSSKTPPGVAGMPSGGQVNAATGATGPRAKPASGSKNAGGGGGSGFDAKHPRIGAGNTGGGRFAAKGSGTSSSSGTAAAAKKPAAKKPAAAKAPAKKAAAGKAAPPKMNATPAKPGPAKGKAPAKPKPPAGSRAAKLAQKTQLQTQAKNDRAKARAIFTQIAQLTAAIHAAVKASAASTASTAATKTAATAAKTAAATTAAAAKTAATAATTAATTTAATTAKTTSSVPAMRAKRAGLRVQAHTLVVRANALDKQAAAIHLTNAGPAAALELAGVPFREELARRVPAGKPGAGRFTEPGDQLTRHATPDQTAVAVNRLAPDQRAVCRATVMPPPGYEWGGSDRLIPAGGADLAQAGPAAIELGVRSWVHELRDRTGKWTKTGGGPQMMRPVRPPKTPKAPGKPGRLSRVAQGIRSRDEQRSPIKAMESALPGLASVRSDQPITQADLQAAVAKAVAELRDSEKKIATEEDKRRRTKLAVHAGAIVAGAIGGYVESRTPGIPQAIAEMTAPGLLVSQELVDWARRL